MLRKRFTPASLQLTAAYHFHRWAYHVPPLTIHLQHTGTGTLVCVLQRSQWRERQVAMGAQAA